MEKRTPEFPDNSSEADLRQALALAKRRAVAHRLLQEDYIEKARAMGESADEAEAEKARIEQLLAEI